MLTKVDLPVDFDFKLDTGELDQIAANLPREIEKRLSRNATRAGAKIIAEAAKQLAPYDSNRNNNKHIRDAIKVKHVKGTPNLMRIGIRSKDAPHAHMQEFGTVNHPPQPFLRPAAVFMQQKAIGKLLNNLSQGILRESRKLSGKSKKRRK